MKKHKKRKSIFIYAMLVFLFFSIFKYIKGKSFFDTLVEFKNNIYSINTEIIDIEDEMILIEDTYFIPVEFTYYKEFYDNYFIGTKIDDNKIYIYNSNTGEEVSFAEIGDKSKLIDIDATRENLVWIELENDIWTIYSKKIKYDSKIRKIDQGRVIYDSYESSYYPKKIALDSKSLVYFSYDNNINIENNIKSNFIKQSLIYHDLNIDEKCIVMESEDIKKMLLYDINIDNDKLIWQKINLDKFNDAINKTEVHIYSINGKKIEKIFETSKIKSIDIVESKVALIVSNPEDNIYIIDINNPNISNIFYKGSKAEKYYKEKDKELSINNINFLSNNFLFIEVNSKNEVSFVIYDLKNEKLINPSNLLSALKDKGSGFFSINKFRLLLNYANIESFSNSEYYKLTTYILR